MASALDMPMLTRLRSMVAASAVLMLTFSLAKALPAISSDSSTGASTDFRGIMALSLRLLDSVPPGRPGTGAASLQRSPGCVHRRRTRPPAGRARSGPSGNPDARGVESMHSPLNTGFRHGYQPDRSHPRRAVRVVQVGGRDRPAAG